MADVTAGAPPATRPSPPEPRPAPAVDRRAAMRWGLIGGVVAVFVAAIGMLESFAGRQLIDPILTVGYLILLAVPFVYGWVAARPPPVLEGYERVPPGRHNVAAGALAGLATGAVLWAFMLVVDVVDVRRIFLNITPRMLELLAFEQGPVTGGALLAVICLVLGAAGAAVHLIPQRWRRPALAAMLWVVTAGLLRQAARQILGEIALGWLADWLYSPQGGLTVAGTVAVLVGVFALYAAVERKRGEFRQRFEALAPRSRRQVGIAGITVALLVLAALPSILGPFLSEVLNLVGIFLLMALGLNIVVGYAGLLDLGYVAFFAVGAYTTSVLTSSAAPGFAPELTFWTALPFVVLAAAMAGVIVGTPVLRMRGDYLAIVTLGFGEIARLLLLSDWLKPALGGAQGITRVADVSVGPVTLDTPPRFLYLVVGFGLLAAYVSWALQDSRIGRAWMAMREDEPVAEVLGINIVTTKLSAFVAGAVLASFAGALFASRIGSIFPHSFNIVISIIVLVIIIVGGMGSLPGVAVGALILRGAPELLREFEEFQFLLYGALLIFMMLNKPEGLIPSKRRAQELHQEELAQDAWFDRDPGATDQAAAGKGA